jgi:Mce-associated membrane protein
VPAGEADQIPFAVPDESHPLLPSDRAERAVIVGMEQVRLGVDLHAGRPQPVDLDPHVRHPEIQQGARRGPIEQQPRGAEPEKEQPRWIESGEHLATQSLHVEIRGPVEIRGVLGDLMQFHDHSRIRRNPGSADRRIGTCCDPARYARSATSLNAGVKHGSTTDEVTDTDVPVETDDGATEAAAPESTTRRRLLAQLSWIVPALAVVLLVVAGVLGGLLYRQHHRQAAEDAAVTAARQVLINAYSIDYHSVDTDYQRFISGTSGDLRSQLTSGKSKFISTVKSTQTQETAQIVDAGLVRFDGDTATVTIALNSPLTNTTVKQATTRSYRTEVDVQHIHGKWLATAIRQVN